MRSSRFITWTTNQSNIRLTREAMGLRLNSHQGQVHSSRANIRQGSVMPYMVAHMAASL